MAYSLNMRRIALFALLLLLCLTVNGQPSYWFQNFQRSGDAQAAQKYFLIAGTNMTFTFDAGFQHLILNAGAGGGGGSGTGVFGGTFYGTFVGNGAGLTNLTFVDPFWKNDGSGGTINSILNTVTINSGNGMFQIQPNGSVTIGDNGNIFGANTITI